MLPGGITPQAIDELEVMSAAERKLRRDIEKLWSAFGEEVGHLGGSLEGTLSISYGYTLKSSGERGKAMTGAPGRTFQLSLIC